jgi:hypothetical protein
MSFQDNFESISGKVSEAAQQAAQKAKDLALIARLKVQILSEEDKIKKAELEVGKLCYRDFINGAEPERGEYLPWYEKITESKGVIDDLKLTIEAIKNSDGIEDDDIPDVTEDDFDESDLADEDGKVIEIDIHPTDSAEEEKPEE